MRWFAGLLTLLFALSLSSSRWQDDLVQVVVWHSFSVPAAVVIWLGVWRHRGPGRQGWAWIAAGLTCWIVGDIAWDIVEWNRELPDVSIVDLFYLLGYALFAVGLVALTRSATGSIPKDAAIDGSILAVAVGVVFWAALVGRALEPGSLLYQIVTAAYPIAALVLLATVAWMRFHPQRRLLPPGTALLAAAMSILVVLEPISAWYYFYEPELELEPLIDRAFLVSFGLTALAVHRRGRGSARSDRTRLHPLRIVLLGAALATGPITMYAVAETRAFAVIASAAISGLVLVRFVLLNRARERAQSELLHLATHDTLTGLPNRALLTDALAQRTSQDPSEHRHTAVIYVDIDFFKAINDTYGHKAGDTLLVELAERIRRSVRVGDLAARLGGDEFVILCERVGATEAEAIAERVNDAMRPPFDLGEQLVEVSISVGVATARRTDASSVDELMRAADEALYEAKRSGRGRVVLAGQALSTPTAGV